jgi:hypothetical protein
VAAFIARAAAAALHVFGVEARAAANVLWTSRGGFVVTQECVSTPLIPVYLAAVLAYASTWRQRALGLVATAPLFVGLGIARLLVVALPAALVASPLYLIHAFYQLLLAAVVVAAAVGWRRFLTGLALLELIQMATLVALHVLASHSGLTPHVRDVRAWAVVGPLLVVVAVVNFDRLLRRPTPAAAAAGGGADG